MKGKILLVAAQEMNNRGVKFTIENVASQLGISKKTIYQYFPSKDVLISQVIDMGFEDVINQEQEILADKESDFAEQVKDLMSLSPRRFGVINDWVMEDIKRYRRQDWERIEQFKYERMAQMSKFLRKGIELGFVLPMNTTLAARLLIGACRELSQYDFLVENNLDSIQVRQLLTDIFLHGVLKKNYTDEQIDNT